MANKIQLRRDTTANWNNVNPILADGEPGLDITTNQVKYGNGANAWVDLSYASGGSVGFEYSTVQEGIGSNGSVGVTSITGNHAQGTGVGLTSENWAQLMWVPDTSVVTVDDIDNGPSVYNWAYVGNDGFHIDSKEAMGSTRSWLFGKTGNLTLPAGGNISYSPGNVSVWSGTPPVTIQEAIDRLATLVNTLNTGTGA